MKNKINIDYDNCLVNLSNSLLKYCEEKQLNESLKIIDDLLIEKNPKNVIVILCDGLGSNILSRVLDKNDFLLKNKLCDISSVYPPTTAAATTSLITGLYPNSHGWIGWENYIKEIDKVVVMYLNNIKDTTIQAAPYNVSRKYFKYETIFDKINKSNKYNSVFLSPYYGGENYNKSNLNEMFNKIKNNMNKKEKNLIYAYYQNPDEIMHEYGTTHIKTINNIKLLNNKIEKFTSNIKDSIVIVVADHGHIDSSFIALEDYSDIFALLKRTTSVDSRASMFFIKDGKHKEFEELFDKYFGSDFILLNRKEIFDKKLFGKGVNHQYFESLIGDYIAIAISNKNIEYLHGNKTNLKSTHSGNTLDETVIPLIVIDKTK